MAPVKGGSESELAAVLQREQQGQQPSAYGAHAFILASVSWQVTVYTACRVFSDQIVTVWSLVKSQVISLGCSSTRAS